MKPWLKLAAAVLAGALIAGILIGLALPRLLSFSQSNPSIFSTATVLRQVQTLTHLVTVKHVLEKVVVLEDVKWYGQNRVLMVAHGVVKAGVDLGKIGENDLRINDKTLTLTVPEPTITDVYLDDQKTRVIEHSTGALRLFDKDMQQNARSQALDDIRRAARSSGIYEDSRERAEAQLRGLFTLLGFESVKVEFKR